MTGSSMAALLGTMIVLSAAPGPADVAVVARSITCGLTHALLMVCGVIVADFVFIVLAVYSLAAVAETMKTAFILATYACAAFLIWLGIAAIRSEPAPAGPGAYQADSKRSSFAGGFLITLGDPKAILFYMGLFPVFVDVSGITLVETITIMVIATIAIGGVKSSYAYFADRVKGLFANRRARRKLDFIAGILLMGCGLFLIYNTAIRGV